MTDHYFTADPSVPFTRATFTAEVWGHKLTLTSGSGVYSNGRLDIGTSVLFKEAPPPAPGRILDLGCGYGVIGLAVAATWSRQARPTGEARPAEEPMLGRVIGIDVNERALLLANENARTLDLPFSAVTPDEVDPAATFDEIWSNPPIRIGKDALHDLLLRWLPTLTPDGRAVLVVGRNLGGDSLQRWLGDQGWPTERIGSAKGFRVLETRRG